MIAGLHTLEASFVVLLIGYYIDLGSVTCCSADLFVKLYYWFFLLSGCYIWVNSLFPSHLKCVQQFGCVCSSCFFFLWMTGCLSRLHAPRSIRGPNVSCLSIWQLLAWSSAGISISRELVAATIYLAFHLLLPFFISNKGSFQILIFSQIAAAITAFLYVG